MLRYAVTIDLEINPFSSHNKESWERFAHVKWEEGGSAMILWPTEVEGADPAEAAEAALAEFLDLMDRTGYVGQGADLPELNVRVKLKE